jgi:thymidylate synthase (FAD)
MTDTDLDRLTYDRAAVEAHMPAGAVPLLDHGFIAMPRTNCPEGDGDEWIAWCARRSYQGGTTATRSTEGLLRYLLTNHHMSPFEHVVATHHAFVPLFVQNQWVRHRTGKFSILSMRYSLVPETFYIPRSLRLQAEKNKQASDGDLSDPLALPLLEQVKGTLSTAMSTYEALIQAGVARELARGVIPTCVYSDMVVTMDLRNLLHLVFLRHDPHAQPEFQVYAREIARQLEAIVPVTMKVYRELRAEGREF